MIIEYLRLLRVKHYIKNLLVFIPLFFSGKLFDFDVLLRVGGYGFPCFCLIPSAVYILNDYKDIEKDRLHPTKKHRPLASGKIKPSVAIIIMIVCITMVVILSACLSSYKAMLCLTLYFLLNVLYSAGLKNRPITDVAILASGFVIRVFYGGFVSGIGISEWLYLVVTAGSLYMGLGKRRNEIIGLRETRRVLAFYNKDFLDKNMYVCLALTNVFYALWTVGMNNHLLGWTIPFFTLLLMRYSLDTEGNSDGDPVEVILGDGSLMGMAAVYIILIFCILYF